MQQKNNNNPFRLTDLYCWVEAIIKATIFETCAISCLNYVCKSVTSVPVASSGGNIGCCKTEATKRPMLFGEGLLRNGSLSGWLKLSHKSRKPVWCQLVTIPWADEVEDTDENKTPEEFWPNGRRLTRMLAQHKHVTVKSVVWGKRPKLLTFSFVLFTSAM